MLDTQSRGLLVRQTCVPLDGALRFKSRLLAYAFARTCRSARQRYDIIFICIVFFSINFVFPHLFLGSVLQMRHRRHLVGDTHVQPAVVVEVDVTFDDTIGVLKGVEPCAIDTFHLYYTVGTLGNGIVRGLVVLSHGDGYPMRLEQGHVGLNNLEGFCTVGTQKKRSRF